MPGRAEFDLYGVWLRSTVGRVLICHRGGVSTLGEVGSKLGGGQPVGLQQPSSKCQHRLPAQAHAPTLLVTVAIDCSRVGSAAVTAVGMSTSAACNATRVNTTTCAGGNNPRAEYIPERNTN